MRRLGVFSLPRVCTLCGRYTQEAIDCCEHCEASLPTIDHACRRCGLPMAVDHALCNRCLLAMPAYDHTYAGFENIGVITTLMAQFKDRADLTTGRFLADVFARRLKALNTPRPQLLVPIPIHVTRFWSRGFDQTRLITKDLTRHFDGLNWYPALKVTRRIKRQSTLPQETRWSNVQGAFKIKKLPKGVGHVALVDDVMSSGATAQEAARTLKAAGIKSVDVWVIARG